MSEKKVQVVWLKEKSGKKIGDIIELSKNMADFLEKRGDARIIKEKGVKDKKIVRESHSGTSSTGNEGSIKKDVEKSKTSKTGVTDVTTVNAVNAVNEKKSVTVVTPYSYIDLAFPETIMGKVERYFYTKNNRAETLRKLAEEIDEKYESLRVKVSQNKVSFHQFKDKKGNVTLQLLQPAFDQISDRIAKIKGAEEEREAEVHRKQRLVGEQENFVLEVKKFYELYRGEIVWISNFSEEIFFVNFDDILEFSVEIGDELLRNPLEVIPLFETAFSEVLVLDNPCFVRIKNLPEIDILNIENFRPKHLDKLVSIEGRIVSISEVRPQAVSSKYECPSCGTMISILQLEKKLREPVRCSCGRRGGFKLLSHELIPTARIILEDLQEKTDNPHASRIDCFLKHDLVNDEGMRMLTPGNEVKCVGVLGKIPIPLSRGGVSTRFEIAMDVNSIELCESEVDITKFTEEDIEEIKDLAKEIDKNGLDEINPSFAPHIFGYNEIKNAIILQLCSKRNKTGEGVRSKQNILMIGDPGTAKSELGRFTIDITPGSRIATGGGSSAVGITASVVREEGEGWRVEPGAMVIAKEILFLDELNNLSDEDKPKLQEGMSEQKITINKANIHMSMKVTAGILAAANPVSGLFRTNEDFVKQYNLPAPIINRFDLIFSIRDIVNKKVDESIAKSMINRDRGIITSKYSKDFLKKFFVYIRHLEDPKIGDSMVPRLQYIYSKLRDYRQEGININPRIHEAMLRILKSSAKIRMSDKIEEKDIERALGILSKSYYDTPSYDMFPVKNLQEDLGGSAETKEATKRYAKEQKDIEDSDKPGGIQ